jgi:hypothetical protein
MGEDANRIKQANIVSVMASSRGAILTLLRARQAKRPAQRIQELNASRKKALTALGRLSPTFESLWRLAWDGPTLTSPAECAA